MAQLRIDFQGRGEVETFSWARVQAMGDDIQLALSVARQVDALDDIAGGGSRTEAGPDWSLGSGQGRTSIPSWRKDKPVRADCECLKIRTTCAIVRE